jgi:hypothetical protein
MSSGIVWRIYVGFVADIDIKILGVHHLGSGMPFLNNNTCAEGGGLFISTRVFFPVCCHPWMDDGTYGWMDGWMNGSREKTSQKTTTMSFTICKV